MTHTISKESLAALVARMRESKSLQERAKGLQESGLKVTNEDGTEYDSSNRTESNHDNQNHESRIEISFPENSQPSPNQILDKYGNPITLNSKQSEFVSLAGSGKSCVLIGAAGTGKTTCQKAVVQTLIESGKAGILESDGHKHLSSGTPGIVICAFTRRAVANIRRNMPADLQNNCITIHKLLEYSPVYYEIPDPATGQMKTTMRFEATRHGGNPLPQSIHTIIFEESSMIGTPLHQEVIDACPHSPQFIYLGDIQQLPPVFGSAILGFKLLELPTIELTEVYRQALESPIISLAHRILSGKALSAKEFEQWNFPGKLKIRPWKKRIDDLNAVITLGTVFKSFESEGIYDPEQDIILIPFNKNCGTIELNKLIANHLARKRGAITYEIVAGFSKTYLSVGDKVLYDKEDAIVIKIESNPAYGGRFPQMESAHLDYWGHNSDPTIRSGEDDDHMDFILNQVAASESDEDRVNKASHRVTLRMLDTEREIVLDQAGDLKEPTLLLGYCLTVHKSQGSEWRRVFFCLHNSHAKMIQRELLYTGVTRAREELYIICESDSFTKGIESQKVKGNTLEEKAEHFKGLQIRNNSEELN